MANSKDKIQAWIKTWSLLIVIIVIIIMGISSSLKLGGIHINMIQVIFGLLVGAVLGYICFILKDLKFKKINVYFVLAIIFSWLVIYVGFMAFSEMYTIEIPFSSKTYTFSDESYINLTSNRTNEKIFYDLHCESNTKKEYITIGDNLKCNIHTVLNDTGYYLSKVKISRRSLNDTPLEEIYSCPNNNNCEIFLKIEENYPRFFILPYYLNKTYIDEEITPIYYYIDLAILRNSKDLEELKQNKFTALIAMITAAFLTVWAGVYYAKKILEEV